MDGSEHDGLCAWQKRKIAALESGKLGFDTHSALAGCVLLEMLLSLSELKIFGLQNGDLVIPIIILL